MAKGWGALVVPASKSGNRISVPGLTHRFAACGMPIPEYTAKTFVMVEALRLALMVWLSIGAKVTETVQEDADARFAAQLVEIGNEEKLLESVPSATALSPKFVSVMVCGALDVPTFCSGKLRARG